MKTKTLTIGTYLLDQLEMNGVEHIFGVPGDYILGFDKLVEESSIQFINATRENTAGYLADGYARVRGLSVAAFTYGVGLNTTNAIAQCFIESIPVIFISGSAGKNELKRCQDLHHLFPKGENIQQQLFEKITCANTILDDPKQAASEIHRVIHACITHKKPVYIEIPRDSLNKEITIASPQEIAHDDDREVITEALEEITTLLQNAKKPVIWAGHEVSRFGLSKELLTFAEKTHIPIASTLLGKSVISERHPLFLGVYQGEMSRSHVKDYVDSCDLMIQFGVMLDDVNTGIFSTRFENSKKIIATSDQLTIQNHSYKMGLKKILKELETIEINVHFHESIPFANVDEDEFVPKPSTKITADRLFSALKTYLQPGNLLFSDIGDCLFGAADLPVEEQGFYSNAHFAAVGWAIPAAIGAQIGHVHRRTVAVVGDGAFQMTGTELTTAVRYGVDPIIILMNNHGFATERPLVEGNFNDIQNWDYASFPEVLKGGAGFNVTTEEELQAALKLSFASRGTFQLIVVDLDKHDATSGLKRFCELLNKNKL